MPRRRRRRQAAPTVIAIITGLAIATGIYWSQNPDLKLKIPEGITTKIAEQRSSPERVPESFAEAMATRTPVPTTQARTAETSNVEPQIDKDVEPTHKVAELERKVHASINAERAKNGSLPQLRWDSRLGEIARAHSEDMTKRGYFSHDTPEGLGPSGRATRAGYRCRKSTHIGLAENITIELVSESLDGMARGAVQSWVGSAGHRANLLGRKYDRTGIGASFGKWRGYDAVYLTQVFC